MKAEKNLLFLKTVIVSVACLSATMAGLLYFFLQTSTDIVESNAQQKITELTQAKAKQMDILFQGLIDANDQVANVPFIIKAFQTAEQTGDFPEAQKSQIRGYLGYLMKKYQGLYENLFLDYNRVIEVDGVGGVSEGYGMNEDKNADADTLSKYMDPVAQIAKTGNSFLGAPQVSPISNRLVLMLLTPIKDPTTSNVIGIFGAPFDMINMAGSIVTSDDETDHSISSYLVNSQGMVLLSSDEESILNLDFSKTSGTQDFYANLAQQSDGYGFVKVDNVEYIASFSHINHGGLTLINTMPVTQYLAEISSLRQNIIVVMIIATLICAGALTLIFYWITKPLLGRLSQAMHTSEQIAQYDLSHSISISGNDEGTRLLTALNEMQNHLKKTVDNIMQSSSQLKNTSTTLSQQATESSTALQAQHSEFEQASSSVSELRQALQSVATSAANAAQASNAGTEHTREGQESVEKTVKSINSLADRLKTTSTSVEDLAGQINNIGTVLDVIRSVAEQTNLLALNAAIESARAGEAGRGFAVVADEVRALAQRTEESTAQIDDIINLVKNSSSGVVNVMSQINTQAQQTLDIAHAAGEKLQQIFEEMELINEGNLMIASTTEEQSQMIQGIDSTLSNLQEESEAILNRVNQTNQSSDQLTALAQSLDDSVHEFKT